MTPALVLALVLLAGSTQNGFDAKSNIADIIASLPEIIANLPDIISGIISNLPISNILEIISNVLEIIGNIPEIIGNLPEINWPAVIDSLPGILPNIVGSIIEIITNLEIDWPAIIDLLPEINIPEIIGNIPGIIDNLPEIISNLPEIIANLPAIIGQIPEIIGNLPIDWPAIIDLLPEIERDPGVEAPIEQFPSLIQLESRVGVLWVQICAGSIISNVYFLTAGHCVYRRLAFDYGFAVRAGSNVRGRGGDVQRVAYSVLHPTYGQNGRDGNIAVGRIVGSFVYGPTIQRIPIVSQGSFMPPGLTLQHASWGSTAQGRLVANRQLHTADMIVIPLDECRQRYADGLIDLRVITDNMICFGRPATRGRKADLRDAGAGLYYSNILVGVQSHGRYVFNSSIPVVAMSVGSYSNWIAATAV